MREPVPERQERGSASLSRSNLYSAIRWACQHPPHSGKWLGAESRCLAMTERLSRHQGKPDRRTPSALWLPNHRTERRCRSDTSARL